MDLRRPCASCGKTRRVTWVRGALRCDECRREMWDTTAVGSGRSRREAIVVVLGERPYQFRSKAEARRTLRNILKVKRLPPDVAAQLGG